MLEPYLAGCGDLDVAAIMQLSGQSCAGGAVHAAELSKFAATWLAFQFSVVLPVKLRQRDLVNVRRPCTSFVHQSRACRASSARQFKRPLPLASTASGGVVLV